jgi:thiosulfate/3-mercaptopyruvate sulfurtransferase
MDSLVSTGWLAAALGSDDLRIIDASYFLAGSGRDARAEYEAAHIPGAVFLDLKDVSDPDNPAPLMAPSAARFASRMQTLGVGDGSRIVVYDNSPLHSSTRAWWLLRRFGAPQVAVLDGGFQSGAPRAVPSKADARRCGTDISRRCPTTRPPSTRRSCSPIWTAAVTR